MTDSSVRRGQAPAKINLYLEVLGRRPDGFHELLTVLQTIDVCDELTVSLRERRAQLAPGAVDVTLELLAPPAGACADSEPNPARDGSSPSAVPSGPDNLVLRAATALLAESRAGGDVGVSLQLLKRIPAGAGLGGGSSDAALTLRLLDELLGSPCGSAVHQRLAATLGSDVPFFLVGGTGLCSGRGEIVEPLAGPRPFEVLLRFPGFGLSTPTVYGALKADRLPAGPRPPHGDIVSSFDNASTTTLEHLYRNDLEAPALRSEPRLASMMEQRGFHLSGSGSTLFRFCPTEESAAEETSGQFVRTVSRTR